MKIYSLSYILFSIIGSIFFIPLSTHASVINPQASGPEFVDASLIPENMLVITQQIIEGYNNKDEELLNSIYDFDTLAAIASKDLYDNAKNEKEFASGLASTKAKIIKMLLDQITRADGYMVFLGYIKRNDKIYPQIRIDLGDFGTDYFEFLIEKNSAGQTLIVDWYQLSTDQFFSQTIGSLAKLMSDPNPGLLKKLFGIVKIDKSVLNSFKAFGKARQAGDFAKANQIYETFPENIRHSKIMLSVATGLASFMQDDELYKKRLSQLAQYHGDDPSAAFLLLDHYFYQGDAEKALENLNVMEKRIGKDGFTTYLKGNLYYALTDDRRRAMGLYKDAISLEPSYEAPYQTLGALYIEDENYADAVNIYKMLETQFEVEFSPDDFLKDAANEKFKASNEFKAWMASHLQNNQ